MVAKCSNPSCSALFRRLAEGRLFRLEPDPTLPGSSKSNRLEYFWLCGSCSAAMTLYVSGEGKVIPVALPAPVHGGPHWSDFISSKQQKGLLLRALASRQKDIAQVRDSSEDGEETMPHEWEELDDEVAAGSSCTMPDCGTLAVAYGSRDDVGRNRSESGEFTCPRCGIEFVVPEDELVLQSVPKDWLLAGIHLA